MGGSGKSKCFLFVYTHHGYFLEELHFDQDYWLNLKNVLVLIYKDFFLRLIFSCGIAIAFCILAACVKFISYCVIGVFSHP